MAADMGHDYVLWCCCCHGIVPVFYLRQEVMQARGIAYEPFGGFHVSGYM